MTEVLTTDVNQSYNVHNITFSNLAGETSSVQAAAAVP